MASESLDLTSRSIMQHSQGHRIIPASVVALAILVSGPYSSAAPIDDREALPTSSQKSLFTYVDTSDPAQNCFAIVLQDTAAPFTPRAIDLGVIIDLSASQSGPARKESIAHLRSTLKQLVGGSRVQIWASHLEGKPLLPQPAAVGAISLAAAVEALEQDVPMGVSDLPVTFEWMNDWLLDKRGDLPKRIVYIGDGQSMSVKRAGTTFDSFAKAALDAEAALFFLPVRQNLPSPIEGVVTRTGGRVLTPGDTILALSQPIFRVQSLKIELLDDTDGSEKSPPSEVISHYPEQLPPLRNDGTTLVVGEGTVDPGMRLTITGTRDRFPATIQAVVRAESSPEFRYLRPLVDRWKQEPMLVANLSAANVLNEARTLLQAKTELWTAQGEAALAERRLDEAKNHFAAALQWDPNNPEAEAGLKATTKLKQAGSVQARPVTESPRLDAPKVKPANREPSNDPLADAKARQAVVKQMVTKSVTESLEESRRVARRDPVAARQILKRMVQTIDASDLDGDTKGKLRSRLESQLRILFREQQRTEVEFADRSRALAQSSARASRQAQELSRQQQDKQLLDEFRTLMSQGEYREASRVADEVVQQSPNNVAALASSLQANLADRYAQIEDVEWARQSGWWNTLQASETSAIPMSDARPVVFPGAKEWEELTKRREKYKEPTLAPVSPAEEKIRKSLTRPITVDFRETPLDQITKFVQDFAGINVVLDQVGLDEAGVDSEEPVSLQLEDIPLKSALKLMLGPLELAYLIKDDVLLITSKERAESLLVTKVYPVADLVIPITNFNSGVGANGQVGGQGMQGGSGLGNSGGLGSGFGSGNFGNTGGGGRGFPRVLSKGLQEILDEVDKDSSADDEKSHWEQHLAKGPESEESLRAALVVLMNKQKYREAVDLLQSITRHQEAPSWTYPALALAEQLFGGEQEVIRRAILSLVDQDPYDLSTRLEAAEQLARAGLKRESFVLLQQTEAEFGPSVNVYFLTLQLAAADLDGEMLLWSTENLLSHEWPSEGRDVHAESRAMVSNVVATLRAEGRKEEAERLQRLAEAARIRDIEVTVHWEGEADIDLAVIEPSNLLCSTLTPRTLGGGVLSTDSKGTTEKYIAAEAWSGEYEIRLQPVWGKPTGGIANVDIVLHKGTNQERRERRTVKIDGLGEESIAPLKVSLDHGRRQEPAVLSPDRRLVYGNESEERGDARAQLRQLANGANAEPGPMPPRGRFGARRQGLGAAGGGGVVAFDPVITPIPNGTRLTAQAVVSADRRFVRLQMVPLLQTIQSINDVRTISVGGAVGGGGGVNQPVQLPAVQNP